MPGSRILQALRQFGWDWSALTLWLLAVSCQPGGSDFGVLVRLHLADPNPSTNQASLAVTATNSEGLPIRRDFQFQSGPFDVLGATFPTGTLGNTTYHVDLFDGGSCLLASGDAALPLTGDGQYDLPVQLQAPALPCGAPGAELTVEVVNGVGGAGMVASQPPGISCGNHCSNIFPAGTLVRLHASTSQGNFQGWTGACTGVDPDCTLDLSTSVRTQAIFGACRGWCQEPSGTTANLYGIWGTSPKNIVAVGDSGTILLWDGNAWIKQQSPVTTLLRAASSARGDSNLILVGNGGTVVRSNGAGWAKVAVPTSADLYGVTGATTDEMYIIGANGTYLKGSAVNSVLGLLSFGAAGAPPSTTQGKQLNAISLSPVNTEHIVVGNGGYNLHRYTDTTLVIPTDTIGDTVTGTAADLNGVYFGLQGIFAVGAAGTLVRRSPMPKSNWVVQNSPVSVDMNAIWGTADNSIYAVGDQQTILFWDGSNWTKVANTTTGPLQNLNAIWGTSIQNLYAVGDGGLILHYLP